MKAVVIAAHPDDELLGAGGALAAHVAAGDEVHAVVLSEGATSRYDPDMQESLRKDGCRAAQVVGFASITFAGMPDQRLDLLPLVEVTQLLEDMLDRHEPEVVYTHFPGDVNNDHRIVAQAAWTASRPYRAPYVRRFAVFETASSTEWGWPIGGSFEPNLFVDISSTLETKLAALECYESELRDYPHPRSTRALAERAAYWGSVIGRSAAEPFQLLREIR